MEVDRNIDLDSTEIKLGKFCKATLWSEYLMKMLVEVKTEIK